MELKNCPVGGWVALHVGLNHTVQVTDSHGVLYVHGSRVDGNRTQWAYQGDFGGQFYGTVAPSRPRMEGRGWEGQDSEEEEDAVSRVSPRGRHTDGTRSNTHEHNTLNSTLENTDHRSVPEGAWNAATSELSPGEMTTHPYATSHTRLAPQRSHGGLESSMNMMVLRAVSHCK